MTLETERLIIREFTRDDVDSTQRYGGDPENVFFMPWGPNNRQATAEFVEKALAWQAEDPRREYSMAICLRSSGEHIGGISLTLDDACYERVGDHKEWTDEFVYAMLKTEWID